MAKTSANLCTPLLVALAVAGCAAPPLRSQLDQFKLLAEGRVPPDRAQAFADCVLSGFRVAHPLSNANAAQTQRGDMQRIETLAGGMYIMVSVDVFPDGRVAMYEAKSAALLNTISEREAFDQCLKEAGG